MPLRFLVLVLLIPIAHAQTPIAWTGDGGDGLWETADNWDLDRVPAATDSVLITQTDAAVRLTAPTTVAGLQFAAFRGALTLDAALTVTGGLQFSQSTSTLAVGSTLDVGGRMTWASGVLLGGTVTAGGGLRTTGASASSGNIKRLDGGRLVLPAGQTGSLDGWYFRALNESELVVEAGATLTVTESVESFEIPTESTATPTIVVDGTLRFDVRDGGNPRIAWGLDASGTIEQISDARFGGEVTFAGPITDRGATYRATAGTLSLAHQTGAVTFGPASRIEGAAGAAVRFGGGPTRVEGELAVDSLVVSRALSSGETAVVVPSLSTVSIGHLTLSVTGGGRVTIEDAAPLTLASLSLDLNDRIELAGPLTVAGPLTLGNRGASVSAPGGITVEGLLSWRGGTLEGGGTVTAEGGLATTGGAGSASNEKRLVGTRLVLPAGQTATMNGAYLYGLDGAEWVIEAGATATVLENYRAFYEPTESTAQPRVTVDGTLAIDIFNEDLIAFDWALAGTGVFEVASAALTRFRAPDCLTFPDGTIRLSGSLVLEGTQQCLDVAGGVLETIVGREAGGALAGQVVASGTVSLAGTLRVLYAEGVTPAVNDFASIAQTAAGLIALPDTVEAPDVEASGLAASLAVDPTVEGDGTVASLLVVDPTPPPGATPVAIQISAPRAWRRGRDLPVGVLARSGDDDGAYTTVQVDVFVRNTETGAERQADRLGPRDPARCQSLPPSATPNYDEIRCRTRIYDPALLPPPPDGTDYPAIPAPQPMPDGGLDGFTLALRASGGGTGGGTGSSAGRGFGGVTGPTCSAVAEEGEDLLIRAMASPGASEDQSLSCAANAVGLLVGFLPGGACIKGAVSTAIALTDPNVDAYAFAVATSINAVSCGVDLVPPSKIIRIAEGVNTLAGIYNGTDGTLAACAGLPGWGSPMGEGGATGTTTTSCNGSEDPNEKLGPGTEAGDLTATHWLRADDTADPHLFTVFFENLATATAAARDVVVTDTLDTTVFDPASFAFAYGGVADQSATIDAGLSGTESVQTASFDLDLRPRLEVAAHVEAQFDPATGVIRWDLSTLDPKTGEEPTDILAGFLPPNDDDGNGEGYVGYRVRLLPDLATDAASADAARIVFDANAAIDTNPWAVGVDAEPPQSAVAPFPSPTAYAEAFEVVWGGDDAASGTPGSGIATYDIYVAINGDTPVLWLEATAETSATYQGARGMTYAFYSIARDRVGYAEAAPETPDAEITVPGNVGGETVPTTFAVGAVAPNPSSGTATVAVDLPTAASVTLSVYDALGRRVTQRTVELSAARHRLPLARESLAAGVYVARITAEDGGRVVGGHARFTVVR